MLCRFFGRVLSRSAKARAVHYLPIMSTGKIISPHFSALLTPQLLQLEKVFKSAGYDFRLVGGVVRDLLLGQTPKDIDIGTDCTPQDMMNLLSKAKIRYFKTGVQHGTLTVLQDGLTFEITTLRVDRKTDGRHAEVEFIKDWKLDALRRDLTINAMSLSLDGTLFDYFQGEKHLAEKQILFVGNARSRIMEDYLRILRYFRFYGRIVPVVGRHDKDTLEAIRELAEGLSVISVERVWMEVARILVGNHAPHLVQLMYELGVAKHIKLPEQKNCEELERVWKSMNSRDGHLLKPASLLATLTQTIEEFSDLATTWKLSNSDRYLGKFIITHREKTYDRRTSIRYFQDLLVDEVKLESVLELFQYCDRLEYCASLKEWVVPVLPVNGMDLKAAGVKPGREMGILLKELKEKWVDSGYRLSKEDLMLSLGYQTRGEEEVGAGKWVDNKSEKDLATSLGDQLRGNEGGSAGRGGVKKESKKRKLN